MKLKNVTFALALVASLLSLIYTRTALAQKGPNENATFSIDFDISAGNQGEVTYDSAQVGDWATFEVRVDGVVELKRYKVKIEFDTAFVELNKGNILFEHPGVAPNPPIEVNILESTGGEAPAPGAIDDSYGAGIYEAGFTLGNVADTLSEMPHGEGLLLFCYPQLKGSFTDSTATAIKILTAALDDKNNVRDGFTLNQSYWILGKNAVPSELAITTTSLSSGIVDSAYSDTLKAGNGTPPYIWSIVSGSLPSGLSLEGSTGIISGVPTDTGTSDFTVMVKDAVPDSVTKDLSITIIELAPVIVVTPDSLDFDSVYVDSSVSLGLIVKNEGTADLTISDILSDNSVFTTDFSGPDTLAPDDSQSVNVTFAPDSAQAEIGNLTINSNADTVTVSLTGVGVPCEPAIVVAPGSLDFDSIYVDSSKSLPFIITNEGCADLVVSDILSDNSVFTTDFSGPDTLAPDGSRIVNVTFTPDMAQAETGTLTISNNDHQVLVILAGIGLATRPQIRVEPASLNFGEVTVDSSFTQLLTIYNDGNADLVVDSLTYPEAYLGSVDSDTISPGESLVDSVTFTPPDTFTYEGPISIYNNDELKAVYVKGTGTPEPVPKIVVEPTSLAFGDVAIGSSADLTFTISNVGSATLVVDSIITPDPYTVSGVTTPDSIEPNDSVVVTVTFTPLTMGDYGGPIKIFNNDVTKMVDVSGRGVVYDVGAEVISCPEIVSRDQPESVFVDLINFGNVTAGGVNVIGTLINVDADTSIGDTTLSVSLPARDTLHLAFDLPSDDTASYHVKALLCLMWAEDMNPANDCDSCSYFYNEVPIRRMGPELPQAYSLSQNYPNPFNPLTQIEYSIPRPGWVRLEVYNILGEKVATLVDREQQPGNYRIGWDARDLRSGIYFCRMQAGSFTFTRRMVLLK